MQGKKYYSIGMVSSICGVPIKTLRYYDQIGLLIPEIRKEGSNYRQYTHSQLITVLIIRQFRFLGFGLNEIRHILEKNSLVEMQSIIRQKLQDMKSEMMKLEQVYKDAEILLRRLDCGMDFLKEYKAHGNIIGLEKIKSFYVFSKKNIMNSYKNEEVNLENWIQVLEASKAAGAKACGPIFVTYYTDIFGQFLQHDCEVEFSVNVEPDESIKEIRKVEGFQAATAIYIGSYKDIIHTYIELNRWINENGYEICGNVTEEFIISPIDIQNEDMHITKIIVPVKKIKKK